MGRYQIDQVSVGIFRETYFLPAAVLLIGGECSITKALHSGRHILRRGCWAKINIKAEKGVPRDLHPEVPLEEPSVHVEIDNFGGAHVPMCNALVIGNWQDNLPPLNPVTRKTFISQFIFLKNVKMHVVRMHAVSKAEEVGVGSGEFDERL